MIHSFDIGTVYVDHEYEDVMLCVGKTNGRYSLNEDTGVMFEPMYGDYGYYDMLLLSVGGRRASGIATVIHVHVSSHTAACLIPIFARRRR